MTSTPDLGAVSTHVARTGPGPVVVGVAPTEDAPVAWAMRHARRHGAPLQLVRAYGPDDVRPGPVSGAPGVPRGRTGDALALATLTHVRRIAAEEGLPGDDLPVLVRAGSPADVLVEAGREASMLVVGHHPGPVEPAWALDSVALGLLRRAPTAVTVVREASDDGPVVVGVDGSPGAARALRHALADGAAREVATTVVVAGTPTPPTWVDAQIREAVRGLDRTGAVEVLALEGSPARTLLEVAARSRASLLVVGHRGRGRAASMLLGSVGQVLLARSPIPVTVEVPPGHGAGPLGPADGTAVERYR